MIIGWGRYRILCFSRCTLVDRGKSCISVACALKRLPSGQQALTLTLTLTLGSVSRVFVVIFVPPSLPMRASALSNGAFFRSCISCLSTCRTVVGKGVRRATAPTRTCKEWELQTETTEKKDPKKNYDPIGTWGTAKQHWTNDEGRHATARSNPRRHVAQRWKAATGETQYPFCANLVCTLFLGSTETRKKVIMACKCLRRPDKLKITVATLLCY